MSIRKSNQPFIAQLLSKIPRDKVRGIVDKHTGDENCKGFYSWTHLNTMVYSQLLGQHL
jgi:hypothetical protein